MPYRRLLIQSPLVQAAAVCAGLLASSLPAQAGALDFLFGKPAVEAPMPPLDAKQRTWRLAEFTYVELVAREPGGNDNQHPAAWTAELLRQQLAQVRTDFRGTDEPLFHSDEIAALAGPLSQALALAKPGDDVLLLSTHRRDNGLLLAPFGITARLFVQGGELQLIVHDSRRDFMDTYLGTKVPPTFTFGSRTTPGKALIRSGLATSRRADWLSFGASAAAVTPPAPTQPATAAQPVGAPAAAAVPAPQGGAAAATAATVGATRPAADTQPAAAAPASRSKDPGFADEIEFRLQTLKRLLDKRLISEEEYQQMRKDVLKLL